MKKSVNANDGLKWFDRSSATLIYSCGSCDEGYQELWLTQHSNYVLVQDETYTHINNDKAMEWLIKNCEDFSVLSVYYQTILADYEI